MAAQLQRVSYRSYDINDYDHGDENKNDDNNINSSK